MLGWDQKFRLGVMVGIRVQGLCQRSGPKVKSGMLRSEARVRLGSIIAAGSEVQVGSHGMGTEIRGGIRCWC